MVMKPILLGALAIVTVLVFGTVLTESVYAGVKKGDDQPKPDAKVRAIQNSNSLDEENPGMLGEDIWCVGGIDASSGANDIHCYLLPEGVPTPDYKTDPNVIKRDGDADNIKPCPENAGFQSTDICFWINFPASDFPTAGHYRFVAEFTKDGNIIDLAGTDFRNHSFMVVPELIIGSIGLVGSTLGTLYMYKSRKSK